MNTIIKALHAIDHNIMDSGNNLVPAAWRPGFLLNDDQIQTNNHFEKTVNNTTEKYLTFQQSKENLLLAYQRNGALATSVTLEDISADNIRKRATETQEWQSHPPSVWGSPRKRSADDASFHRQQSEARATNKKARGDEEPGISVSMTGNNTEASDSTMALTWTKDNSQLPLMHFHQRMMS
jgi:hypothetical protein